MELDDGSLVTAHCPNTGSMKGCSRPGRRVYLSKSNNPKRKLNYTWELMETPRTLIGINTLVPNRLVKSSVQHGLIRRLSGYDIIRSEVKTSSHTRLDLCLEKSSGERCYIEIKNCTLVEKGIAKFPDAVTLRGQKHLGELEHLVSQGHRAVIFFLIQRMDADSFSPASDIDPDYAKKLLQVCNTGVEVIAKDALISLSDIRIGRTLPVNL